MSTILTIDIAPFYSGDSEAKQAVAAQIGQACQEIGFFSISGHNVTQALLTEVSQVASTFFDLPLLEIPYTATAQPPSNQPSIPTLSSS